MPHLIHQRLFVLFVLLGLIVGGVGLTGQAMVRAAGEAKTLDRNLEPAIVEGVKVPALIGAPVDHLFVYTYSGATRGDQIPVQVDEVSASGDYVLTENGLLDANDEIVFMAKDTGDRAPDTTALTGTLPISNTWYEIEVIDPTAPSKKGWAYLVRSGVLAPTFSADYANYSGATQVINASQFELRIATSHVGMDRLVLNGSGVDILDRTKLRVVLDIPLFGSLTLTEESLAPAANLVKDGPVRALLQQDANGSIAGQAASLNTTYKAYGSMFEVTSDISFTLTLATLSSVRTTIDLDQVVSPTTFYNANAAGGITIDGTPDSGVDTPLLSNWAQVSHSTGRSIQVVDPTPAGGTISTFYRDDKNQEASNPTGQPGSYGESGFLFTGVPAQMFSIRSSLYILSPADDGTDNVGATYEAYYFNPLIVSVGFQGGAASTTIFLPIVVKES